MALSRSLATMAAVAFLSVASMARGQQADDGLALIAEPHVQAPSIEQIAKEANELKAASRWKDYRAKLNHAEKIHREQSAALAEQRKMLDEAQNRLDATLATIERSQIMIQAILAEVRDLDDEILKLACQRVNAEAIQPIASGKPEHEPLIYSLDSAQAGRLLAVIEKRRPTQIVSRPSILAVDGQAAEITVGQNVKTPVTARVSPKDEHIEWKDELVGLAVSLTPSIQDNKQMRLDLIVDDSYLSGDPFPIFVEKKNGKTVRSPVVNRKKMQTKLETADGQTILVAVRSKKEPADETEPTKTTLILLTPRVVADRTAAVGEFLHH